MKNKQDNPQYWQLWGAEPQGGFPASEPPQHLEYPGRLIHSITVAFRMLAILTLVTGVVYPLAITLAAKVVFPRQATGSALCVDGKILGSELLAQRFASENYFWPRPSAGDDGTNYATVASSASNKGPTAADLKSNVAARAVAFRQAHGLKPDAPVPSDMLLASGSGLDPHISPEAARLQIERVANARRFSTEQKRQLAVLVEQFVEAPQFGILGEPRVNVLKLNLALTQIH
jgi:K+-transporting ATPase ATPase C chain